MAKTPSDWLESCDLVVNELHDHPEDPTGWIRQAVEAYPIDILAHPTNRLVSEREPLDVDMASIVETAAENNVALEINAQPKRLDLDWRYVK